MPLVGFRCPDGKKVSFEECLSKECPGCLPRLIRMGLLVNRHERAKEISATALNNCIKKTVLERTVNYYDAPSKLYYSFRGTLAHSVLRFLLNGNNIQNPLVAKIVQEYKKNLIVEQRLYRTLDGLDVEISGQFDVMELNTGVLTDWKSTSWKNLGYLFSAGPRKEQIDQLNVYRWIAAPIVEVKKLQLGYICMEGVYCSGQEYQMPRKLKGKTILETKKIAEVPILPEKEVEEFIYSRAKILVESFGTGVLPPPGGEAWLCNGFCPFKGEHCDGVTE